ncbi:MAG: hypothetical protein NVSMB64_15420 [Candidatus Velthaea sp.]
MMFSRKGFRLVVAVAVCILIVGAFILYRRHEAYATRQADLEKQLASVQDRVARFNAIVNDARPNHDAVFRAFNTFDDDISKFGTPTVVADLTHLKLEIKKVDRDVTRFDGITKESAIGMNPQELKLTQGSFEAFYRSNERIEKSLVEVGVWLDSTDLRESTNDESIGPMAQRYGFAEVDYRHSYQALLLQEVKVSAALRNAFDSRGNELKAFVARPWWQQMNEQGSFRPR